jgi:hypothetical protein
VVDAEAVVPLEVQGVAAAVVVAAAAALAGRLLLVSAGPFPPFRFRKGLT